MVMMIMMMMVRMMMMVMMTITVIEERKRCERRSIGWGTWLDPSGRRSTPPCGAWWDGCWQSRSCRSVSRTGWPPSLRLRPRRGQRSVTSHRVANSVGLHWLDSKLHLINLAWESHAYISRTFVLPRFTFPNLNYSSVSVVYDNTTINSHSFARVGRWHVQVLPCFCFLLTRWLLTIGSWLCEYQKKDLTVSTSVSVYK